MPGEMSRRELGVSAPAETGHSKYPGSSKGSLQTELSLNPTGLSR